MTDLKPAPDADEGAVRSAPCAVRSGPEPDPRPRRDSAALPPSTPNPEPRIPPVEPDIIIKRTFSFRLPRWAWFAIASWLASGLFLVGIPAALEWLGDRHAADVGDDLRACRTRGADGLDDAETADRLYRAEAWFPFWQERATPRRAELIARIVRGLEDCRAAGPAPDGLVDRSMGDATARLPEVLAGSENPRFLRRLVEGFLLRSGREREIVALEPHLSRGGDVELRVRAHLRLGDPAGAARVWSDPRVTMDAATATWLGRGVIACLAGDYADALPALDATWRVHVSSDPGAAWRAAFLDIQAECASRAGATDVVLRTIASLEKNRVGAPLAARYRAELAPGTVVEELRRLLEAHGIDAFNGAALDDQLLALWLFARHRSPEDLLNAAAGEPVERELESLASLRTGVDLFQERLFPPLDEPRLLAVVDALTSPPADIWGGPQVASHLLVLLAVRLGRRWDPRLDETLDRAAALRPGWDVPARLRDALRALHEDPAALSDASLDLPALLASPLSPSQKIETLRRGPASPESLSSLLLRLTRLVVAGRSLGLDVQPWTNQLAALRAMVDAQPNDRLLRLGDVL